MAGDTKDVELRIRARDYSQKTLEQLTETLTQLVKAQDAQLEAAKKGESSSRALEKSYEALANAGKALIAQSALVKSFQNQSAALEEVKARVEAARRAQQDYLKTVDDIDKVTKEQSASMRKLAQEVTRAERSQAKLEERLATTGGRLAQAGINTNDLNTAQQQIVGNVTRVNTALERQDHAIENLDGDLKVLRETQARANAEAALALKAANDKAAADDRATREAQEAAAAREKQLQVDRTFTEAVRRTQEAAAEATRKESEALKAQRAALDAAADQAERLAREYAKMAKGGQVNMGGNLAASLKDIADPLNAAVRSLDGIDGALTKVEKKIETANGPIKNLSQSTKELEAAQKSLQNIAGQVDAYQRQMNAVKGARAEVQRHRQALAELVAQARSGTGGAELAQQMVQAQAALKRASMEMGAQTSTARTMRDALRTAGVDTKNLAAANDQIVASATRTKSAVDGLGAAYKKYGSEVEKVGQHQKATWFDGGRTTLSWMQRIRGEVLGLTTTYIGLQAAIKLAQGAVDAAKSTDTINSRLGQLVGQDTKAIAAEWDFLLGVSDRLGLSFEKAALSYSKFGIATKGAGMDVQTTRFIFEGLAEAATVARLSTDEFERALRAMEQMISKGQISAEELKGQLGDALPGAMSDLAKSMGVSVGEVLAQMEKGAISAEFVIDLARQWKKQNAEGLDSAANSMQAQLNRLETAQFLFKKSLADQGFIKAYSEFIEKLVKILRSDEGQQLAKTLSEAFSAVVSILQFCVENLELLKIALSAFAGLKVFGFLTTAVKNFGLLRTEIVGVVSAVGGFISTIRAGAGVFAAVASGAGTVAGAATGAAGAVGVLTMAIKLLARSIPIIGLALTAYEVYNLLASGKKKDEAKQAGKDVSDAYKEGLAGTTDTGASGKDGGFAALMKEIERENTKLDKKMEGANLKGAKADLAERKRIVEEHYAAMRTMAEKSGKDETDRAKAVAEVDKLIKKAMLIEEKKFYNEQAKNGESAASRRVKLAEEVAQALIRINDDIEKRKNNVDPNADFETRRAANLKAISHEYDKLLIKVGVLERDGTAQQKKDAAIARERITAYSELLQKSEGMKLDQDEIQRREKQLNEQIQLRVTLQDALKAQRDAGKISEDEYQAQIIANNTTMAAGVAAAAASLKELVEAKKELLRPEDYQSIMANISAVTARNNAEAQNASQQLLFSQEQQSKVMDEHQRKLAMIRAEEEAGLLTRRQAVDATAALNAEYRNQIITQAEEVKGLAMAAMTPENQEAMLALISQMDILILKTQDARNEFTYLEQTIVGAAANAIDGAFNSMVDGLEQMVTGQMTVADGFKEMGRQSLLFFAQFMRDIAVAMLRQMLFNAMKNSGNPYVAAAGAALSAGNTVGSKHRGGMVDGQGAMRRVAPSVFAGAPRFHEGGLPGLQPNEVPTVLQKGEEVLTRDDPRHVLNGGGDANSSAKFVLLDDRARISEAMQTSEGESAMLVNLRKNLPTLRSWLK